MLQHLALSPHCMKGPEGQELFCVECACSCLVCMAPQSKDVRLGIGSSKLTLAVNSGWVLEIAILKQTFNPFFQASHLSCYFILPLRPR